MVTRLYPFFSPLKSHVGLVSSYYNLEDVRIQCVLFFCVELTLQCLYTVANIIEDVNSILNCDSELSVCLPRADAYLHLPILVRI